MTEAPSSPIKNGSGEMFDRIATRYDRLNRLISFGLDQRWRKRMVQALNCNAGDHILDVATGTADVAISIAHSHPEARITGLDPSQNMLHVGREKITKANMSDQIQLVEGDAQALPFEDETFSAVCISFGIRNVPDRSLGLKEMVRVTRKGGRVAILELSEPTNPLARLHVHHVVPWMGACLSGSREYRYLQTSVAAFPSPKIFAASMEDAGLSLETVRPFAWGSAHLFVGRK
jgi:demethylmenaquinone methyltransferase/2-methoxy-6-polyprenyl-1,4-benzoquinol methylase